MDAARRTTYRPAMPVKSPLYERDFFAWSREQADLLGVFGGALDDGEFKHQSLPFSMSFTASSIVS